MQPPEHSPPPDAGHGHPGIEQELAALEEGLSDPTKRLEFLYGNLSVLDSKASSLMAFNAIGLTALAVWLESIPLNWLHLTLDLVFLLFLASSATCFLVVRVHWSPSAAFRNPHPEMRTLLQMRDRRTRQYRISWKLSILAVGIFAVVSAVHMAGTVLHATGACGDRCTGFYSKKIWGSRDH